MARPDLSTVPEFYHKYIGQVPENDLSEAFDRRTPLFINFLENIPGDKIDFAYAEGKWTVREVLQHIIDAERVFTYRALRFARKDATPLPSFDENLFAANARANKRIWEDLIQEFKTVRSATEWLFRSFDPEQLNATGIAGSRTISVLAIGYITAGHPLHHLQVIQQRYL